MTSGEARVTWNCRGVYVQCEILQTYGCIYVMTRIEALRRWQSKQGIRATYGNLLESFVQAGHTECAEVLCEVLRKKCEGNS